jgi:hypothetical protein
MRKRSSLLSMPPEFMKGYQEALITIINASRVHVRIPRSVDNCYQCLQKFMKGYEEAFITTISAPRVHERVPGSVDYYYQCLKSSLKGISSRSSLLSRPQEFMKGYQETLITIINASRVHERVPGSVDYYYKCLKSS